MSAMTQVEKKNWLVEKNFLPLCALAEGPQNPQMLLYKVLYFFKNFGAPELLHHPW